MAIPVLAGTWSQLNHWNDRTQPLQSLQGFFSHFSENTTELVSRYSTIVKPIYAEHFADNLQFLRFEL